MARNRDEREDEDDDDRPRRRSREEEDDEDYEAPRRTSGPQTTNPGKAKAAAILWIIVGSLGLIGGLLSVGEFSVQTGVQIAVALAFLITGIQTLVGAVGNILGAGIASVILAALGLIVGLGAVIFGGAVAAGGGAGGAAVGGFVMIVGIVMLIGPTMLLVAGILAIISNKQYKAWLAYKKGQSRGSKSRRQEDDEDEEEEDERPRKRRPRTDDDD